MRNLFQIGMAIAIGLFAVNLVNAQDTGAPPPAGSDPAAVVAPAPETPAATPGNGDPNAGTQPPAPPAGDSNTNAGSGTPDASGGTNPPAPDPEVVARETLKSKYPNAEAAYALLEAAAAAGPSLLKLVEQDLVRIWTDGAAEVETENEKVKIEAETLRDAARQDVERAKAKAAEALRELQELRRVLDSLTSRTTATPPVTAEVRTYRGYSGSGQRQ